MQDNGKGTEAFTEEATPAIQYVIDGWNAVGDGIIINGRVTELSVDWNLKRGEYTEQITGHMKLEPDNLKCDIVLDKISEKIKLSHGDTGLVGEVFKRIARELELRVQELMVMHMEEIHTGKEVQAKPTRVSI